MGLTAVVLMAATQRGAVTERGNIRLCGRRPIVVLCRTGVFFYHPAPQRREMTFSRLPSDTDASDAATPRSVARM